MALVFVVHPASAMRSRLDGSAHPSSTNVISMALLGVPWLLGGSHGWQGAVCTHGSATHAIRLRPSTVCMQEMADFRTNCSKTDKFSAKQFKQHLAEEGPWLLLWWTSWQSKTGLIFDAWTFIMNFYVIMVKHVRTHWALYWLEQCLGQWQTEPTFWMKSLWISAGLWTWLWSYFPTLEGRRRRKKQADLSTSSFPVFTNLLMVDDFLKGFNSSGELWTPRIVIWHRRTLTQLSRQKDKDQF